MLMLVLMLGMCAAVLPKSMMIELLYMPVQRGTQSRVLHLQDTCALLPLGCVVLFATPGWSSAQWRPQARSQRLLCVQCSHAAMINHV